MSTRVPYGEQMVELYDDEDEDERDPDAYDEDEAWEREQSFVANVATGELTHED